MSELHVDDRGTGDPVLLLHSSGLSGRQWARLAADLVERGMRAIVPDLGGHGRSPAVPEPEAFSIALDVDRVAAMLRSLGRVHVIGHSYGGLVGLLAARAEPGTIRSLQLFDPVAFGVLDPIADRDARAILDELGGAWGEIAGDHERWLQVFVEFWGGAGAWAALREPMRAEFRRVAWAVREGVRTLMQIAAPASEYAGFRFPVQLVTGELSPLPARRVDQRLAEAIPGARLEIIAGAGHLAPVTDTPAVNRVLLDFLSTREGAR